MKFHILLLLTVGSYVPQGSTQGKFDPSSHPNWALFDHANCGSSYAERIIGGKNASLGDYPWIARIGYFTRRSPRVPVFKCGAAAISENYVITAAHCVTGIPKGFTVGAVRLGEHNTLTDPDCERGVCADPVHDYAPVEIVIPKNYDEPALKHDIALIRLDRKISFTEWVMPICMMPRSLMTKILIGSKAEVAGWGIYDMELLKPSVILQKIQLPIVENHVCVDHYKSHIDFHQMCVGGIIGEDSCGGDSGGPLMYPASINGPPKYYLIGLVSFGTTECGAYTIPGVYTRISVYMEWILDQMKP